MKNDIEEKILEYLKKGMISSAIPSNSRKVIAKDISALIKDYYPREFVEWIQTSEIEPYFDGTRWWIPREEGMTTNEVFDFWQNLPENKK